jgi:hypothetical protein
VDNQRKDFRILMVSPPLSKQPIWVVWVIFSVGERYNSNEHTQFDLILVWGVFFGLEGFVS